MVNHEEIKQEIQTKFAEALINDSVEYGTSIFEISADKIYAVLEYFKKTSSHQFDFLTTMCGLHSPEIKGKEMGVMYQVKNLISNDEIRFKTFFSDIDPKIQSVTSIFPTANWMERQEYDFFGIQFEGHPDLRRILNMDEMDYFPMRKEYKLEDATRDDKEDKYFGR